MATAYNYLIPVHKLISIEASYLIFLLVVTAWEERSKDRKTETTCHFFPRFLSLSEMRQSKEFGEVYFGMRVHTHESVSFSREKVAQDFGFCSSHK